MKETFLKLIDENQGIIHKISILYSLSAHEREDLVQEIILQLWRSYPQFKGNAKFSTWMYRVAINTALMNMRNRSIDLNQAEDIDMLKHKYQGCFDRSDNEDIISLYMAIDQLSPVNKAIIILHLDGSNYQEIGDVLGLTHTNVGVRINRIKDQLKKIMYYEKV